MERTAARFEVTGVVQGVGFRPFVHRLATELGLDGSVGNDSTRVFVEVAGRPDRIDDLAQRLVEEAPPLARIDALRRSRSTSAAVRQGFRIVESKERPGARTSVPPDSASSASPTCAETRICSGVNCPQIG